MKYVCLGLLFFFSYAVGLAQKAQEISGRVTQMGQPLANVNILIDKTGQGTHTDSSGFYKIAAQPGSTLTYSFTGLLPIKIIVEDVTKTLNITMEPKVTALDEVTVTRKKLSGQEELAKDYSTDKAIVKTMYGFTDTKKAGARVSVIDEDKIKISNGLDLASTIEGWFIGVIDKTDPLNPKFYDGRAATLNETVGERGRVDVDSRDGSSTAEGFSKEAMIFDVDGQVFDEFPTHILNDVVERIAIIPGQIASGIYGMRARGGVIVINTIGSNVVYERGTNKIYDYERLRGNFYVDDTTVVAEGGSVPNYILELKKATSKEQALNIYNEQDLRYGSSPYFKLNVADYFMNVLKDQKNADKILDEVVLDFSKDPVALKALAYKYDVRKDWKSSTNLYKKILTLRPKYAQSYRDLANSYSHLGDYGKALSMYVRYGKIKEGYTILDQSMGIDSVMESEYKNIALLHGNEVFRDNKIREADDVWAERVLVEWNNSEAEFQLQIIHPNSQFFTIDHSLSSNANRIENEKIKGYSSEQIWIGKNDRGIWNVNLKYLGNKSYDPTYFKITLYKNWGLPNQSEEIKVYRMDVKNTNKNVLRFAIVGNGSNN